MSKITDIVTSDNVTSLAAIAGLVFLEAVALFNGIDGAQFGVVVGVLGTYAAIKRQNGKAEA